MGPFPMADALNIEDGGGGGADEQAGGGRLSGVGNRLTTATRKGANLLKVFGGTARGGSVRASEVLRTPSGSQNKDNSTNGVRQLATAHSNPRVINNSTSSSGPNLLPAGAARGSQKSMPQRSFHSQASDQSMMMRAVSLDDPVSLRGVDLDKILGCFGALLDPSVDADMAWDQSQVVWEENPAPGTYGTLAELPTGPVRRKPCPLRGFISLSWKATRATKYLALAIHYQLRVGLIIPMAVAVLLGGLASEEVLTGHIDDVDNFAYLYGPECAFNETTMEEDFQCQVGSVMTFLGVPLFLLVVFFRSDFMNLFGRVCRSKKEEQNPMFLEVACCRQDSEAFRSNYFSNLPAFLFKSKTFVVILDSDYLQSASSIMELMMFLVVQPRGPVNVLQERIPTIILTGAMTLYFANLIPRGVLAAWLEFGLDLPGTDENWVVGAFVVQIIITGAFFGYFTSSLHHFARKRWAQNDDMIKKFHIEEIYRDDEASLEVMEETIHNVLYEFGYVNDIDDTKKALQVFNRLVRDHAPLTLEINLPRNGVHYFEALAMLQATWWVDIDRLFGIIIEDDGQLVWFSHVLVMCTLYFAVNPLLLAGLSWYVRRGNLSDSTHWIWLWMAGSVVCAIYFAVEWCFLWVKYQAIQFQDYRGWYITLGMAVVSGILCYFTRLAYRSQLPPPPKMKKDKS